MKKIITSIVSLFLTTACSPVPLLPDSYVNEQIRNVSAGATGCHPNEIQILEKRGFDTISLLPTIQTWTISCKGIRFMCSGTGSSCKEIR